MKNLITRSITGILFGIVLTGLVYYSFDTFLLLILFIAIGSFFELKQLFEKAQLPFNEKRLYFKTSIALLLSVYPVFLSNGADTVFSNIRIFIYAMFVVSFWAEFLLDKTFGRAVAELLFLFYWIMWIHAALHLFYFRYQSQYSNGLALSVMFTIWANDTFAYFTGMVFGKNKLMPAVSPKKTVEGWIGGVIFAVITACLCYWFLLRDNAVISAMDALVMGFVVGTAGTAGDLIESKIKRMADVKDSGNLFPGHGGVLDRFDAWFLVMPVMEMYGIVKDVMG
ncbi:MAG: phosphatidate cytidylyltransferase [Bacteroidia bacterium]|nr:MAG: phosphatidate cytidylyltransferase [Bacteroidia bacterium]